MAHHDQIAAYLSEGVFFAQPGIPWQRGTNENTYWCRVGRAELLRRKMLRLGRWARQLRTAHRAARHAARLQWLPANDPAWLKRADLNHVARAWADPRASGPPYLRLRTAPLEPRASGRPGTKRT
jgi:hypothetical protein